MQFQNLCPWAPISAAKASGQDEVHQASLQTAWIYDQLFAAECLGRVDLLSLIQINVLCLVLRCTPMLLSTHQTLMALCHFIFSEINSEGYLVPLSLPDLGVLTNFSTDALLSAFLLYVAKLFYLLL